MSTQEPGVLATALRENQYGVLLLDEFEKSSRKVMDLFLQVLDEGFFSDASGKRVNVRDHIIIATSNAGSDLIFKLVEEGRNLTEARDEIIESIISLGIFRPEFINRFDGAIVFHPLGQEHLSKVAEIMLAKLNERLKDKNIELEINEPLVSFLVSQGQDPKFGARPLNRAIQDKIESAIAKRLIDGSIKPGDKVSLSPADLV